jgi:hypothetical protein
MAVETLIRDRWVPAPVEDAFRTFSPSTELGRIIKRCFDFLPGALALELLARVVSVIVCESSLALKVIRGCGDCGPTRLTTCPHPRAVEDYGVVSRKQVTAHGVKWIVNCMAGTSLYTITNMKFHAIGTGTTAEAATDTLLVTELTTEYNPDNTRATGTTVAGVSGNNATYQSVGTNTLDSGTPAVTEHLLESSATKAAETEGSNQGFDRSVFSAINLTGANGDGLQSTYTWTANSGG